METKKSSSSRWILPLIVLAIAGTAFGFYLGRAGGPARQPLQPIIDAFYKSAPAPPLGTLIRTDSLLNQVSGPADSGPLVFRYGQNYYIDITAISNSNAREKIINYYADFYAAALGTRWTGTGGGPGMRLMRGSNGSFDWGGLRTHYTHHYTSSDIDMFMDIAIVDYPDDYSKTRGEPIGVLELSAPPNGRRVMWVRCVATAHNVWGPAKFPE